MTTLLTSELIDRCHAGSRNKGFWDETPPQGQQLMLIISELAESLEAHRKGRTGDLHGYEQRIENRPSHVGDFQPVWFQEYIKDSVGDELADAYIRLCDFIGGFELDKQPILTSAHARVSLPINFAEALLRITSWVVAAYENELAREWYLADCLTDIEFLCDREGIDLATHIDLKLRYNATRPNRHNKLY